MSDSYYRLYADGSSHARSAKPGGWGWILVGVEADRTVPVAAGSGGHSETSNNRMELTAVIAGLYHAGQRLSPVSSIEVVSDSQYALGIACGRLKANTNLDLVEELRDQVAELQRAGFRLAFSWVRGHAGEHWNELADALATAAKAKVVASLTAPTPSDSVASACQKQPKETA